MKFLRRSRIMRISIFLVTRFAQKTLAKILPTLRRSRTQGILRLLAVTSLLAFYQNCGGTMNANCNGSTSCDEGEYSSQSGGKKSSAGSSGSTSGSRGGNVVSAGSSGGDGRGGTTPGWSTGGSTGGSTRGGTVNGGSSGSTTGGGSTSGGASGGVSGGVTGGTSSGTTTGGVSGGVTGGVIGGSTGGVSGGVTSGTTGGVSGGVTGGTTTGTTGGTLPLRISTQPTSQDVYEFSQVKLSIIAEGGTPPYCYAWTLNGSAFTGSYVSNAPEIYFNVGGYLNWKNQGDYKVTVTDHAGVSITSATASIRIKEAEVNCANQDYFNITETRPEVLVSMMVPDSPTGENMVPLKNYMVTTLGTKYLIPVNSNPFYIPGGTAPLFNPISIFMSSNYIQKSGWRMPATNHGSQVTIACTAAVNGVSFSNWLKDFNEFPNNPNPLSLWYGGGESGGSGDCQFWSNPEECARANTSTYVLRGSQVYECRNNKFKYVSGSCSWEYIPPPPDPGGGGDGP